jgi:hypothetical protein
MHPHHDFIIMAFILEGELTHINTLAKVDILRLETSTRSLPIPAASTAS